MILNGELIADVFVRLNASGWSDLEYIEPGPPDGRGLILRVRGRNPVDPTYALATWSVLVGWRPGDITFL